MNILLLGINGDIGKSILEKIYSKENNYFLSFSKKKPDLKKKNLKYIRIDFSKKNSVRKQIKLLNKFNFNIVINNVGDSNPYKNFTSLSDEDIYQSFNINVKLIKNAINYANNWKFDQDFSSSQKQIGWIEFAYISQ